MRRLIEYRVPHGTVKAVIHGDIPESLLSKDAKRNARLISDIEIGEGDPRTDAEILDPKSQTGYLREEGSWL